MCKHLTTRILGWLTVLAAAPLLSSCEIRQEMWDQPKYEPYEVSDFFEDGMASRPAVEGTVARGRLNEDEAYYTGREDGQFLTQLPVEITGDLLARGRERFNIYCAVCHDRVGAGKGIIVQRGYKQPPSFHIDRLRYDMPIGYFYDVIKNGFGVMPSYSYQVPVADRWAIVAYLKTLQVSQHVNVDALPEKIRQELKGLE